MRDIRTLTFLYNSIESDYAWRISELSNYRSFVIQAKGKTKDCMLRGGITLLYAHWEGFVKNSADLYYSFVTNQNNYLYELNNSFISIALRSELENLVGAKKISIHNSMIDIFFNKQQAKPFFSSNSPIRTSNLKYEIFEDICLLLGIDINEFHSRYKINYDRNIQLIIDEDLLAKRNTIAHGNYLSITVNEYKSLYDIIVNGLLYNFKEVLIDCATQKKYLKQ
jgi:hypothetical protein